jgi:2-methylcitrate dehydratase PrpD
MQYCLGLAAAQCSGLLNFVDDPTHMQKSFQTGIGARNGVTAAMLAKHSYRAAPEVLTTKFNMLTPFSGNVVPGELLRDLGERYEICGTTIKQHACCANTHAALDALLSILRGASVSVEDIQEIEVQLAHTAVVRVDHNALWTHNIQYVLALGAHEGPVQIGHFSDQWTTQPDIRRLSEKVKAVGSDKLQAQFPAEFSAIVSVKTADAVLTEERSSPRGHFTDPLTAVELNRKFHSLAADVLPRSAADAMWQYMMSADLDSDLTPLFETLASSPR